MSPIAARLAAASRALVVAGGGLALGPGSAAAQGADAPVADGAEPAAGAALPGARADWSLDASMLFWSESDSRVDVTKTLANLSRETGAGALTVGLVHDTMSGASPTGALRGEGGAVTYSGASGGGADGADDGAGGGAGGGDGSLASFDDERVQASVALERDVGRRLALELGGVVSRESDHESLGGNAMVTREAADKLSSVELGLALTADTIRRSGTGGTPEPLADTDEGVAFGAGTRNTVDVSLGLSRVVNRTTVARATLQLGRSNGYHTDPYKVISVVDADGRPVDTRFESRPPSCARARACPPRSCTGSRTRRTRCTWTTGSTATTGASCRTRSTRATATGSRNASTSSRTSGCTRRGRPTSTPRPWPPARDSSRCCPTVATRAPTTGSMRCAA